MGGDLRRLLGSTERSRHMSSTLLQVGIASHCLAVRVRACVRVRGRVCTCVGAHVRVDRSKRP